MPHKVNITDTADCEDPFAKIGSAPMVTAPSEDAFYLPADWCRQAMTWLIWPPDDGTFDAPVLENLRRFVLDLAQRMRAYEPVVLVCAQAERAELLAQTPPSVKIETADQVHVNFRNQGPTFLVDGKGGSAAIDWTINPARAQQGTMSHQLLGAAEIRRFRASMGFAGSAFTTDGLGTLIALKPALFNHPDNEALGRLQAYTNLKSLLDVQRLIWLDGPLQTDTTGSDLLSICRFVGEARVLQSVSDTPEDPDFQVLWDVRKRLSRTEDAAGRPIEVIPLKRPAQSQGSYTSYHAVNAAIFVPFYDCPEDQQARKTLQRVFPHTKIEPVDMSVIAKTDLALSSLVIGQPARLLERHKATILPKSAYNRPVPDWDGIMDAYIEMVENAGRTPPKP